MPALLAAERHHIAVDLTDLPTGPRVRCVSTVTFNCREPGAETFIDCAAQVLSATLNGRTLPAATDGRNTLPGLAEHNSLPVESVQADTAHDAMHNARIWRGAYDQRQNMITRITAATCAHGGPRGVT